MSPETAERIIEQHRGGERCPRCQPYELCPAYIDAALERLGTIRSTTDTGASRDPGPIL